MTDRMKSAVDLLAVGGTFILALALLNALDRDINIVIRKKPKSRGARISVVAA